jgi:hypothetical protein
VTTEGEDSIERALQALATRLDGLEARVEKLDGLEPRVALLEVGLLRVERQLHLVYEQGQAVSKSIGMLSATLADVAASVRTLVMRANSAGVLTRE